jgi:cytochrome c oxidase cbb3-type subunit 3
MSLTSSIWIIILTLITGLGSLVLLLATARLKKGQKPDETTGHVWDDDLTEYNKPLPRWWLYLFLGTIIWGVGFLIWFPGFGSFAGVGNWTSEGELRADLAAQEARAQVVYAPFREMSVEQLVHDPAAQKLGRNVFANHCAACHGSDAGGNIGFPNLTDAAWQWGGEPQTILTTVLDGRQAAMPPWKAALGSDAAVSDMTDYVLSLSGRGHDVKAAERAAPSYASLCVACHGPAGGGNPLLGAPALNDQDWLYGGDRKAIGVSIAEGRNGYMPPQKPLLGEDRVKLAVSWVYAQSRAQQASAEGTGGHD